MLFADSACFTVAGSFSKNTVSFMRFLSARRDGDKTPGIPLVQVNVERAPKMGIKRQSRSESLKTRIVLPFSVLAKY